MRKDVELADVEKKGARNRSVREGALRKDTVKDQAAG